MGCDPLIVHSELSGLQYDDRGTGSRGSNRARRTVSIEFSGQVFHIKSLGSFSPDERNQVCKFLYKKVKSKEDGEVKKLHVLYATLHSISCNSWLECDRSDTDHKTDSEMEEENKTDLKQSTLMNVIQQYFSSKGLDMTFLSDLNISVLPFFEDITPEEKELVRKDVCSLTAIKSDHPFTGRVVTRIFYGIGSPLFPAVVWGKWHNPFWRRHIDVDFNQLYDSVTKKLLELKGN